MSYFANLSADIHLSLKNIFVQFTNGTPFIPALKDRVFRCISLNFDSKTRFLNLCYSGRSIFYLIDKMGICMYQLGDFTLVHLEKVVLVVVVEDEIFLRFDDGKELSQSSGSHDNALSELRKIKDTMTP